MAPLNELQPINTLNSFKAVIIYARADEDYKNQFLSHLRPLINKHAMSLWHDGDILPGEQWEQSIMREINSSDIILILISANSLNSEFILKKELKVALERLSFGLARLVPIVVSSCAWHLDPILGNLQALPIFNKEGVKPVQNWSNSNDAWTSVVAHLDKMFARLYQERQDNCLKNVQSNTNNAMILTNHWPKNKKKHPLWPRITLHMLFWLVYIFVGSVLVLAFSDGRFENMTQAIINEIFSLPIKVIFIYFSLYYLWKQNNWKTISLIAGAFIITIALSRLVVYFFYYPLFFPGISFNLFSPKGCMLTAIDLFFTFSIVGMLKYAKLWRR